MTPEKLACKKCVVQYIKQCESEKGFTGLAHRSCSDAIAADPVTKAMTRAILDSRLALTQAILEAFGVK